MVTYPIITHNKARADSIEPHFEKLCRPGLIAAITAQALLRITRGWIIGVVGSTLQTHGRVSHKAGEALLDSPPLSARLMGINVNALPGLSKIVNFLYILAHLLGKTDFYIIDL